MTGNRILQQMSLNNAGVIDVPVPADAITADGLPVTLVYSGAETQSRCLDERMGADHLHIAADAGLSVENPASDALPLNAALELLPRAPALALPPTPSEQEAAAALTVVAARGFGGWSADGPVRIVGAGQPALQSIGSGGRSGIAIGGADPAAAARALFSGYGALLTAPSVPMLALHPHHSDELRFSDLNVDTRAMPIGDEGGWTVALPAARIPHGQTVRGLDVAVSSLAGDAQRSATLSLWMNGQLLGSAPMQAGETRLRVDVPPTLLHSLNGIEVRVMRSPDRNCGDAAQHSPVQLEGGSRILLGKAGPVADFHDWATRAGQGVTVVLPGGHGLDYAAAAAAALLANDTPIRVSYGAMPAEGPILLVSAQPPDGTSPALRAEQGRLIFAPHDGSADFDLPDNGQQTVVQLVEVEGRPVLWIRPARTASAPPTMWLDSGDTALVAPSGAITPLSAHGERVSPAAPLPQYDMWFLLHSKWLYGVIGLLLVIGLIIWSLRPSVRRAKPGQDA